MLFREKEKSHFLIDVYFTNSKTLVLKVADELVISLMDLVSLISVFGYLTDIIYFSCTFQKKGYLTLILEEGLGLD